MLHGHGAPDGRASVWCASQLYMCGDLRYQLECAEICVPYNYLYFALVPLLYAVLWKFGSGWFSFVCGRLLWVWDHVPLWRMCNCPLEYIFNTFWSLMGTYYKSQNLDNKNSEFQWGSRNAGWQLRAHLASCPTPAMPTKNGPNRWCTWWKNGTNRRCTWWTVHPLFDLVGWD